MNRWIVIANSSFAGIYENQGGSITHVDSVDFPEGRKKARDIYTDSPGRSFDKNGSGRHALTQEVDYHMHEQQVFAHDIAEFLHKAKSLNKYEELVIIAPPQFLGELRKEFSSEVRKLISKEFTKDLPNYLSEGEKIDTIRKYLDLPKKKSEV